MAISKKYEKNLNKIQSYLDGDYKSKIQVGYQEEETHRKVGDKWVDSEGIPWEQKEGYRLKGRLATSPRRHYSHDMKCKGCKQTCTTSYDKDTYKRMSRCYNCQVQFELDLQYLPENKIGENGNKWQFWLKLQALKRWEFIDNEANAMMMQKFDEDGRLFDESVANAIANANVGDKIKFNKKITGG